MSATTSTTAISTSMKRSAPDFDDLPSGKRVARQIEQELGRVGRPRTNAHHQLLKQKERLRDAPGNHHGVQRQTPSSNFNYHQQRQNHSVSMHSREDAATMGAWLNEWATAPSDPLPSNIKPLSLVLEPAAVDLKNHKRIARDVSLVHYVPTLVPEGRAAQDRELERLHDEVVAAWHSANQEKYLDERDRERRAVVEAARHAEVIDLTGEQVIERRPLAQVQRVANMPINMHWDPVLKIFRHPKVFLQQQQQHPHPPAVMSQQPAKAASTKKTAPPLLLSWQKQLVV